MLGVFAFPALLPHFMQIWELSGNQAGWINAGVITAARADLRGATMALQSVGGFGAPALGTIAAGWVLDLQTRPPRATVMASPLTPLDSSDARKAITSATSAGVTTRPPG